MDWRRKQQPTPVFLPGESQGRGSLVGCRLWGCTVGHDWSDLAAAAAAVMLSLKTWTSIVHHLRKSHHQQQRHLQRLNLWCHFGCCIAVIPSLEINIFISYFKVSNVKEISWYLTEYVLLFLDMTLFYTSIYSLLYLLVKSHPNIYILKYVGHHKWLWFTSFFILQLEQSTKVFCLFVFWTGLIDIQY